jgi:carbon-monoxide dehydrogenase small subunit
MKHAIALEVNGRPHRLEVEAGRLLVEVIREDLGLTGTKRGCESNICGTCTVLVNGLSVHACCLLAVQANGKRITTIEGLSRGGELHPVQRAFIDHLGFQCGFCTPGMIMSSVALLDETPDPSPEQVRLALTGNICRCTGYIKIVKSVLAAATVVQAAGRG